MWDMVEKVVSNPIMLVAVFTTVVLVGGRVYFRQNRKTGHGKIRIQLIEE